MSSRAKRRQKIEARRAAEAAQVSQRINEEGLQQLGADLTDVGFKQPLPEGPLMTATEVRERREESRKKDAYAKRHGYLLDPLRDQQFNLLLATARILKAHIDRDIKLHDAIRSLTGEELDKLLDEWRTDLVDDYGDLAGALAPFDPELCSDPHPIQPADAPHDPAGTSDAGGVAASVVDLVRKAVAGTGRCVLIGWVRPEEGTPRTVFSIQLEPMEAEHVSLIEIADEEAAQPDVAELIDQRLRDLARMANPQGQGFDVVG